MYIPICRSPCCCSGVENDVNVGVVVVVVMKMMRMILSMMLW